MFPCVVTAQTARETCSDLARQLQVPGVGVWTYDIDTDAAIAACSAAIAADPEDDASRAYLADAYEQAGQDDLVTQHMRLLRDSDNPDAQAMASRYFISGADKDLDLSLSLARRSAESGNLYGIYRLARVLRVKDSGFYDPAEALRLLEQAGEAGQPYALALLGDIYMYDDGRSDADKARAITYYRRAAEIGEVGAMAEMGRAYRWGVGIEADPAKAIPFWSRASDLGSAYSSLYLGYIYLNGTGVPVDRKKAELYFTRAAEAGRARAHFALFSLLDKNGEGARGLPHLLKGVEEEDSYALDEYGTLLAEGRLVEKDLETAVDMYLRAAKAGFEYSLWRAFDLVRKELPDRLPEAVAWARESVARNDPAGYERLGTLYALGQGVPVDPIEAARLYEKAYRLGDSLAAFKLANNIAEGQLGFRDQTVANGLFEKAAELGSSAARVKLAWSYFEGRGLEKDQARAIDMAREAISDGHKAGRFDLAYFLVNADEPLRDREEAARLYTLASAHGSTVAASNLAEMFETGLHGEPDPVQARKWYEKAAEADHARALYKVALYQIEEGGAAKLTKAAQNLAKAAVDGWEKAETRLNAAFSDASDPLHPVVIAPDSALAEHYLDLGLFYERAFVDCGVFLDDCGKVGRQRLDLAQAAEWYRRASAQLPKAQFWLGRLLAAHPEFEATTGEGRAVLDVAAATGQPEAQILLALPAGIDLDPAQADTRFAAALHDVTPENAAFLAALATIGRFGDAAMAPGWRWLEVRAAAGDAQANLGRFVVTMFLGAFDEAATHLNNLPDNVDIELAEVDYSLRQALRFLMNNVRDDVTPTEAQLTAMERLITAFETREPGSARELKQMLDEVRLRLQTRDSYEPLTITPGLPLAERIAATSKRIDAKLAKGGLSPHLVPLYQHLAQLQAEAGDAASAERSVYQAMRAAREMNDGVRHLNGSLVYHMEMACWQRKGSDLLFSIGADAAGLTLAKAAVNELQAARGTLVGLPENLQNCFRDLLSTQYRRMADLLIQQTHLNEAQWVLDQLKDFESFRYANRAPERAGRSFDQLQMSAAQAGVMARIHGLPLTETIRLAQQVKTLEAAGDADAAEALRQRLEAAQEALADSLDTLVAAVEDLDIAGESEIPREVSARALRRLGGRLDRLDGVAMVYSVTLPERTHFLIVTGQGTEHRTVEMSEADLNGRIRALRAALSNPARDPRPLAQAFYADIWADVEAALSDIGAQQVLLSFDGLMRYVPIVALHDGTDWLVSRRDYVTFTSASRDLLLDNEALDRIEVEALGATRGGGGFSALPYVRNEVTSIVGDKNGKGRVAGRSWLDDAFDADALSRAFGSGAPVIHVATHFRLTDREDSSAMLLGDGQTLSVADLKRGVRRGSYDLADVHMLVLSACETALSEGSELESLAAEVQWEGVRTVLATLWPVADRSTARFMEAFYGRLEAGDGRAQALRAVQVAFAGNQDAMTTGDTRGGTALKPAFQGGHDLVGVSHPFYWAGFQMIGQWR
ncbi:MAG: CHAT domain-containing protein [Pseudooceanicola sp.]|nr:CHAT domain-containing protein [Pseudooceanicola sp.]